LKKVEREGKTKRVRSCEVAEAAKMKEFERIVKMRARVISRADWREIRDAQWGVKHRWRRGAKDSYEHSVVMWDFVVQ
jgi:hypothetical protein